MYSNISKCYHRIYGENKSIEKFRRKRYNYGRKNKVNYIIIDVYCKMSKDMI